MPKLAAFSFPLPPSPRRRSKAQQLSFNTNVIYVVVARHCHSSGSMRNYPKLECVECCCRIVESDDNHHYAKAQFEVKAEPKHFAVLFFFGGGGDNGEYFQNAVPVYTSPKQVQSTSIGLPAGMNQLQLCPLFPSPRHCFKRPAEKYKRKEGTVNQRNQFSTTTQLDCATCLSVNSQQPIALCVCCRPRQHVQMYTQQGKKKRKPFKRNNRNSQYPQMSHNAQSSMCTTIFRERLRPNTTTSPKLKNTPQVSFYRKKEEKEGRTKSAG